MKARRIIYALMVIAVILSVFAMALQTGAAPDELRVSRHIRSRTAFGYQSDEELMELLHVDRATLKRMCEDAYHAVMTNTEWEVSSYGVARNTEAAAALFGLIYRNPELFFVSGVSYYRQGEIITRVVPRYVMPYEEAMVMHGEMIEAAQEVVCRFKQDDSLTDLELALLVHDYLAANCEYYFAESAPEVDTWDGRYSAYFVFVKGTAVCQGYAEAYDYIMNQLGIDCGLCRSETLNHAWNIIELDGLEYHVDVTWDDPTYDRSGRVVHTNFLRSTEGLVSTGHNAQDFSGNPTNTEYDSAFWQTSKAAFCLFNGSIYYINGSGVLCTWDDGVTTELLPLKYKWYASASSVYGGCYSTLATDGESLFFSSPKEIYKYHPESNTAEVVYTYSNPDEPYYNIYGFHAKDNKFYLDVFSSPNFKITTKRENQIVYTYRTGEIDVHIYDKGVCTTEPTCTATGVKTYTCTACGNTKTETIAALGHNYASKVTAPTCTGQGYTTRTCTRCSSSYKTNYTAALGHTEIIDKPTAPTCTETGLTEGKHCSVCHAVIVAQESVPALGHTEVIDKPTAPTCTETGLTEGKHCSVCQAVIVAQETVPALGHTEVIDKAVAATCTETGLTEGKHCSVCHAVIVAQETVPALGHTEIIDKPTAPTCTETGLTEGKHCSVCHAVIVAQESVPALGHTEVVDKAVAPTCTETGLTEGKHCSVCHAVIIAQETVPALGHTEVIDKPTAPTCTETGLTEGKHCSVCQAVIVAQETVPALGHTEVIDKAVAATCTETGLTEGKHCSVCHAVIVAQETVPALGHTEVVDKAVAATCTETGLTEGKHCSVCQAVIVAQETVPALEHDYVCTDNTDGTHTATCNRCNDSFAEAHSFVEGLCFCGGKELTLVESIKIYHTLDLASDISITFAVPQTALATYDAYYLEVALPEFEGNTQTGTSVIRIEPVESGKYYYFTLTGITAIRMNDMVDATLHMTRGTAQYISAVDTYSVATYAYGMLGSTTDSKMLTLCADLLRYGAEAQRFKGYRTDALVDAAMTDEQRAYLSDAEALTFTETDGFLGDLENPTLTWVGKTLDLGSKVGIKFVFNAKNYSGEIANLSMKVSYMGGNGEVKTITLTGAEVYNANRSYYAFTFYGLLASELRTVVDVAVYEGETQLSETLRYSAETYASKNTTGNLAVLCKAIFAYSDSAKAYFTK